MTAAASVWLLLLLLLSGCCCSLAAAVVWLLLTMTNARGRGLRTGLPGALPARLPGMLPARELREAAPSLTYSTRISSSRSSPAYAATWWQENQGFAL